MILNLTGWPLSTLPEVAVCSTLSLGSRTIVRDLLPAMHRDGGRVVECADLDGLDAHG